MIDIISRLSQLDNFSIHEFTSTLQDFLSSIDRCSVQVRTYYCEDGMVNVGLILVGTDADGIQLYADYTDDQFLEINDFLDEIDNRILGVEDKENLKTMVEMVCI